MNTVTADAVVPFLLRILAEFPGRFALDDQAIPGAIVVVGPQGNFIVAREDCADSDRLEWELREWAKVGMQQS